MSEGERKKEKNSFARNRCRALHTQSHTQLPHILHICTLCVRAFSISAHSCFDEMLASIPMCSCWCEGNRTQNVVRHSEHILTMSPTEWIMFLEKWHENQIVSCGNNRANKSAISIAFSELFATIISANRKTRRKKENAASFPTLTDSLAENPYTKIE